MLYEEFYKQMKESKNSDKTQRRKYIRTQCKRCECIIEYDARRIGKHTGYCKKCRTHARKDFILSDDDVIYESAGHRTRGVKINCKRCNKEMIIAKCSEKKHSGYCKNCTRHIDVKPKSIEQIKAYIKQNVIVNSNGCWIWKKMKDKDGYGIATVNTESWRVHRLSYTVFIAPIPEGKMILHECHEKSCCNFEHLHVGDNPMNMREMREADRQAKGEKNASSKLTENDVLEIKKERSEGAKSEDLAKKYNLNTSTINRIFSGKSWSHVPWPEGCSYKRQIANAKISDSDVMEIKKMLADGVTGISIARKFNISKGAVSRIKLGQRWKDVTLEEDS